MEQNDQIINIRLKWPSAKSRERLLTRFFTSWLMGSVLFMVNTESTFLELEYINTFNLFLYILNIIVIFMVLTGVSQIMKNGRIEIGLLLASIVLFASLTCYRSQNIYVAIGFGVVSIAVIRYFIEHYAVGFTAFELSTLDQFVCMGTVAGAWIIFVMGLTILRYLCYKAPCYDMGIFAQMFYYMREHLVPDTTCERATLLSHFKVHMSPAFYFLLPIYFLFPYPPTLLVIQALLVAAGAVPLYLLCRKHQFSQLVTAAVIIAFFLFPSNAGGCFYDFHENKMLTVLVLWLMYFIHEEKTRLAALFAIMTLMVKEDAGIYVACIGLYVAFGRKKYKKGFAMFGVSVVYFFIVVYYLSHFGDGAMMGRYSNYILGDGGALSILVTPFKDPAYLFTQVFTVEKFEFLLCMVVPVMGLPFITRKISDYLLLIPFLVINLMSNNGYQSSIFYQYTFGVSALFFYLVVEHLDEYGLYLRKKRSVYIVFLSLFLFVATMADKTLYLQYYQDDQDTYVEMSQILSEIPQEKSIACTTYLVPKLSQRDVIYKYDTTDQVTDYVIFDLVYQSSQESYASDKDTLLANGYTQIYFKDKQMAIFLRTDQVSS